MSEMTIMRVLGGSHAYGLDTPDSDEDYVEVYVESECDVLGPHRGRVRPTHTSSVERDVARYPLRRFVHLALQGNPTVLESLWAPCLIPPNDDDGVTCRRDWDLGHELRGLRASFVGTHVRPRYLGYMRQQTLRLLGLRGGHSAGKANRLTEASERVGYDTKYAAHVLRLGYQCLELLTTGELVLPMCELDERRLYIMSVRRGEVTFEDWFHRALNLEATCRSADVAVPSEPDGERVEAWCVQAHLRAWGHVRVVVDTVHQL